MENNQSLVVVKQQIVIDTKAEKLEKLLQAAEDIHFDKNNLSQNYEPLKLLRELKTRIDEIENPHKLAWQTWNSARKSLLDPIEELLTRKGSEFTKLAYQIKKENAEIQAAIDEETNIKNLIDKAKIGFATAIAASTKIEELVLIEKQIGFEKRKTTTYKTKLQNLIDALDELRPKIAAQKENLKLLVIVKGEKKQAEETGNDELILQAMEKETELLNKIDHANTEVQHLALDCAMRTEVVESEHTAVVPNVKRTTKSYEIKNVNLLLKRRPELCVVELNASKVKELIKVLVSTGQWKDDFELDGIRFFEKESY